MRFNRFTPGIMALAIAGIVVAGCGGSKPAAEPAKAPAAPAAAAPAAAAPAAAPAFKGLIVTGDVVRSTFNVPADQSAEKGCVLNNRYLHNEGIVFRVKVVDPATGKLMDDKALKSVELKIGDAAPIPLKYGGHPSKAPVDFFWSAGFHIPMDFPSGKLAYKITATAADGRTGAMDDTHIKGETSEIVILDGSVPTIATTK